MKKTLIKKLIAAAICVALAGGGGYAYYWMNTPQYAAGEIEEAVRSRDYQLFAKRVDLEKVYSFALDDTVNLLENDGVSDHQTAASIIKALKGPIVSELINQTQLRFQGKKPSSSVLEKPIEIFNSYMGSAALSITNIADIEQHGREATARVKLHDKKLNRDFTWQLLLEKDVNNNWVVVKIENFPEYLTERMNAENKSGSQQ